MVTDDKTPIAIKARNPVIIFLPILLLLAVIAILAGLSWRSSETVYPIINSTSALLALFAGTIAIVRYYSKKSITFLYIGTAFLGTAVLELYESTVTLLYTAATATDYIVWSWLASRIYLSFFLCLGFLAWDRNKKLGKKAGISETTIYLAAILLTLCILLTFSLVRPPYLAFIDFPIHRPLEFVPGLFFLLAAIGHIIKGKWQKSVFERWLLNAIALNLICQVTLMPFSAKLFDNWFNAANWLKLLSYLAVIGGLCIEMYYLFKQAEKSQAEALQTNLQLQREIDERKRAQEELSRSEKQFKALVEASPTALIVVDERSKIVLTNPQTEKLFQYSSTELQGESIDILVPERYREHHHHHQSQYFMNPKFRPMHEGRHLQALRKDKTEFPVEIGLAPMETDNGSHVLATIVDISVRQKTESALLNSQGRLQAFIKALPDIAFVFDEEGRFLEVFTSKTDSEAITFKDKTVRQILPQNTALLFLNTIQRTINSGGKQNIQYNWRATRGDRWFEAHTSLLQKSGNSHAEVIWVSYDISDRKNAELELKAHREELEKLVEKRTGELQRTNIKLKKEVEERKKAESVIKGTHVILEKKVEERTKELNRSNEELKQFAYVASHDLQEPLRKIRSFTELLATRYDHTFDNRAKNYMHYILDGAQRMQALIRALLSYSRVSRYIDFETINLEELVGQVLVDMEPSILESNARIKVNRLPPISANRILIAQLFQNLIGNALKYHSDNALEIHIGAIRKNKMWEIYVQDNGIGMETEFADRVFILFQRLHNREQYSGTGIGLSICKKVVELHGGEIRVETQPGHGATFYFTLPQNGNV